MPDLSNIELATFIPSYPLHWTSILHYLLLLATLVILVSSRSDVSIVFILVLGGVAMMTGADLYADRVPFVNCFMLFLLRVGMFGLPLLLGGLSPSEETRGIAIVAGLVAGLPLFAIVFLGWAVPFMADPRVALRC